MDRDLSNVNILSFLCRLSQVNTGSTKVNHLLGAKEGISAMPWAGAISSRVHTVPAAP